MITLLSFTDHVLILDNLNLKYNQEFLLKSNQNYQLNDQLALFPIYLMNKDGLDRNYENTIIIFFDYALLAEKNQNFVLNSLILIHYLILYFIIFQQTQHPLNKYSIYINPTFIQTKIMKNQLILGVITALIAGAALFNLDFTKQGNQLKQFQQFKQDYGRIFTFEENIYRFNIFASNLEKIEKHNADKTQTYTLGITQFTDMTTEEFLSKILMKDLGASFSNMERGQAKGLEAPSEVDWRNKGVLNPVKNQGQCGSCWAFSTTGALESNVAVAKGGLNSFSEQQLVDCCGTKGFQCQGCSGAWPEWAFNYINSSGIVLESEYAYKGVAGACKNIPTAKKYLNSARPWTMLPVDGNALKEAIASTGPVSICVDASNWSLYKSGVFANCGTTNLNHAVTAVGYQADGVWLVRNSWGASWGDQGHIRLATGNTCGLLNHAVVPNLA